MTNKNKDLKLVKVGTVRKHMDAHFRDEISYSEAVNRINIQANKNMRKMKAKLTFKLPEDRYEYDMAVNGSNWHHVAWEMYQYLRGKTKYASDDDPEEYTQAMSDCKDKLFEIMRENNVDFDL